MILHGIKVITASLTSTDIPGRWRFLWCIQSLTLEFSAPTRMWRMERSDFRSLAYYNHARLPLLRRLS